MQFLSVRCLNCSNLDTFPRFNYDEIPYCSQCASTSNLVPEPPQKSPAQQQQHNMHSIPSPSPSSPPNHDDELATLFSRNLYLTQQHTAPPPTPPMTSPTAANFSVSQHYHHSSHQQQAPPSPPQHSMIHADPVSAQLFFEQQQQQKNSDREYAEYLMSSDLSSPNSINELEIAVAHGIISSAEYYRSIEEHKHKSQLAEDARRHQELMKPRALDQNCSAMDLLSAARRKEDLADPVFRTSEWFNDYYGGVDMSILEDEEAPCNVYASSGGCRLRPFDL